MIFKRFLRPEWKHPEPDRRVKAIADLSLGNVDHKAALRELAFNDSVRRVRLSALEKLADLSFWWLAYRQDRDEGIREKCKEQILALFSCGDISESRKSEFCGECPDNSLLAELFAVLPEAALRQQVLEKLNKQELYARAVVDDANESLRLWCVERIGDEKTLRRLSRKTHSTPVNSRLQARLEEFEQTRLKPQQIEQQATLIMSQLNALADKLAEPKALDNPQLEQRIQRLREEWQALADEMQWHPHEAQAKQKFTQINTRVEDNLSKLKARWQADRDAEQSAQRRQQNAASLAAEFNQFRLKIEQAFSLDTDPVEPLQKSLAELNDRINQQELEEADWSRLNAEGIACEKLISDLQAYPARLASMRELLEQLAQMDAGSADAHTQFQGWQKRWKPFHGLPLPAAMQTQWQQLSEQWESASAHSRKQAHVNEKECRRLLGVVSRSVQGGQYKRAIRLFHKASGLLPNLPQRVQYNLEPQVERLGKRIAELEDWHEYIAQPRLTDLLSEIQLLAEQPLADPEQQSAAVKDLRKRWQQLIVDASQDHVEEQQLFDQASEKAFSVCRDHYAKLQHEREQHLAQCQQLCEQIEAMHADLDEDGRDPVELESQFRKLTRQWQHVGEIDFKQRNAIRGRYRSACAPIHARLNLFYADNASQKQGLVDQALALVESDDPEAGRAFAALMNRWKQVGYAGKADRGLWKQFSSAGNTLRDRQRAGKEQQMAIWREQAEQASGVIETLNQQIIDASDASQVAQAMQAARAAFAELDKLGPRDSKQLYSTFEQAIRSGEAKISEIHAAVDKQSWQQFVASVQALLEQELASDEVFDWRAALASSEALTPELENELSLVFAGERKRASNDALQQRHQLLLMLELLNDLDSPAEDSDARQQCQVEMLAERMRGGAAHDSRQLVRQWIQASRVSSEDKPMLARLLRVASQL